MFLMGYFFRERQEPNMNNGLLGQVFVLIYTNSIYLTLAASKGVITLTFLTF